MSIFAKDCPQCAETNPAYALRCRCGFVFGSTDPAAEAEADAELTLQEEKLYQEYLAARAEQAAMAAQDAAKVAAAQPANRLKAKEAEQAKQAAERAKAELEAQTARLTASMQAADPSRAQPAPEPVSAPRPTAPMNILQSDSPPPQQPADEVKRNGSPLATALTSPKEDPAASPEPSSAAGGKGSVTTAPATGTSTRIAGAPKLSADAERADKASTVSSASVEKPAERADAKPSGQSERNVSAKSVAHTGANRENSANAATPPQAATSPTRPKKTATWLFPDNDSPSSDAASGLSAESERAAATGQPPNTTAERSTLTANKAATTTTKAEAAARAKKLEETLKAAQSRRLARSEHVAHGSAAAASKVPPAITTPASTPTDAPTHSEDRAAKTAGAIDRAKPHTAGTEQTTANTPTVAVKKAEEPHDAPSTGNARPAVQPAKAIATPKATPQPAATTDPKMAARPRAIETASTQANRVNDPSSTNAADKTQIATQAPKTAVTAGQNPNPRQELAAALEALEARAPTAATTPASQTASANDTNEDASQTRNDLAASANTAAMTNQSEQTPASAPVSPDSTQPPQPADKKDCPNCTTLLPLDARRCRCGFEFPTAEEKMPSLSLSDADVAALEGGVQPSGITRLG